MGQIVHDTIILERAINAPVAAVWNAYADPIARAQWSVPVGEAMVFDQTDFREGGQDHYRCGPPESLGTRLCNTTRSLHIASSSIQKQSQLVLNSWLRVL